MAKDAYYFSHDTNARNDPKILMLRAEYGMEGLGFYWCLLELMAEQADYKININDSKKIKAFALHLNSKSDFLLKLIEDCVSEFELFKDDKGLIYSESLLRRMAMKDAIREKRSKAGKKGGKAKAKQTSDEQASDKQEPSKDEAKNNQVSSNEKEKEKESKENGKSKTNENKYSLEFEGFWKSYPRKEAKQKAYDAWKKAKPNKELTQKIMESIEAQKQSTNWTKDNGQFIPHPASWLNAGRWDDEITQYKEPGTFNINDYGAHDQI